MIFKTRDLSIGYKGRAVVSGIDVSLEKGEILSVIGPNGSGKSTFLKTVCAQLSRIGGGIFLDDKELSGYNAEEISKKISLLLTDRIKPEYMTGREVIESGRYPYTGRLGFLSSEDKNVVDGVLSLTGTGGISDKIFNDMSDGEKQRILFARALCQEPELLIMDEPLSYLDIRYQLELIDIIKQLCREKKLTVIMSIHEIFIAGKISDRMISFKDGKVFHSGKTEEVFTDRFVMELYDIDEKGIAFIKN